MKNIIHAINIMIGILTIVPSLFFVWGVLAFGPKGNMVVIIALPLAVILIWAAIYYLQIKFQTIKTFIALLLMEFILFFIIVSLIELK